MVVVIEPDWFLELAQFEPGKVAQIKSE